MRAAGGSIISRRTTAPTVSGPASAPLPTSSRPTTISPRAISGLSKASRSFVSAVIGIWVRRECLALINDLRRVLSATEAV